MFGFRPNQKLPKTQGYICLGLLNIKLYEENIKICICIGFINTTYSS